MSISLEQMYNAFLLNKVPDAWVNVAYPSLKPLSSWFKDLQQRIEFLGGWLYNGPPDSFWLPAFFFPQGFMTAALQTYARSTQTAIDTLQFRFSVHKVHHSELTGPPELGVFVHGLFMQGAKWDATKHIVDDSDPKVPIVEFPTIWLEPTLQTESKERVYQCPMYKTSTRAGELSTTGHSTNFVIFISLPHEKLDGNYWICRGTALLCMTDD